MREADLITLLRTVLVFPIAYAILYKINPIAVILVMVFMFAMDAMDGFAAISEKSNGKVGLIEYLGSALGNGTARKNIDRYRHTATGGATYGPRLDVAGDRVTEYVLWIVFVYVNLVPLWVLFLVIMRHAFADALMGAKGTSSKMRSRFARAVYTSNFGRAGVAVVKFLAFSYLDLEYVWSYPSLIGEALVAVLFVFIMVRGAAEIYENL